MVKKNVSFGLISGSILAKIIYLPLKADEEAIKDKDFIIEVDT